MSIFTYEDITVRWNDHELEFGNSGFSRRYAFEKGLCHSMELCDGFRKNVASAASRKMACTLFDENIDHEEFRKWHLDLVTAEVRKDQPFEGDHVFVSARFYEEFSRTELVREFFIYPGLPMFGLRNRIKVQVIPLGFNHARSAIRKQYSDFCKSDAYYGGEPVVETIHPADNFKLTRSVEFFGHTDVQDRPVVEHPAKGQEIFNGNLIYCEDPAGTGFLCLQEAPPSSERREVRDYDFRLTPEGDLLSLCWGINSDEIRPGMEIVSYRNAFGVYRNEEERESLVKRYMKARFCYGKPRYAIVCNAWGCGRFYELLSTQYLKDEVRAAAQCGADIYQIDDNWENGKLSDLSVGNAAIDLRKFWSINRERNENGSFDYLCDTAREAGIDLALWMAPTMNVAYQDYRAFADRVLELYRAYGFRLFKIDGTGFSSHEAEENFRTMIRIIREESGKEIFFNFDVTAGQRGGYFMLLEHGNLFLENRYACHLWGLGYHPERTLRNAWNLARYTRLQTIQVEVPFPGDVNRKFYEEKKESQPDTYSWEYWFAIAFFANPLMWFSPSTVPAELRPRIKAMADLHKFYRNDIFAGEIYPVGKEPSGHSLTGLVSKDETGKVKFAVIFREKDAEESTFALPGQWELITGSALLKSGSVTIPEKGGFAVLKAN